ncbi:hypothetical protein SMITH_191 [Smithella sp. ME-1]|nr:hypothetical protein SMITH_191 [Smithella sp. ME-1]
MRFEKRTIAPQSISIFVWLYWVNNSIDTVYKHNVARFVAGIIA